MLKLSSSVFAALLLAALSSCARHSAQSLTAGRLKQSYGVAANAISSIAQGRDTTAVSTQVTLRKSAILNRAFLYGANLQFSSVVDSTISTSMMALSLGQVPVSFSILDNKLRLTTDASINFESDVDHPARLVDEFKILSQDADTITIEAKKASPIMETWVNGNDTTIATRASWIRSLQYVDADELFLIESSVETVDGSVGEFMETLQPRERQVPANAQPVFNDPDLNPAAKRYRFLDAGPVYLPSPKDATVRIKTQVAEHWLLANGQPVQWYITANVPDQYLADVKNAVEGWNRYSKAAGMPDLIKFMGKLPDGVKVGDPRYNLIVWDSVQDAGAAYESQNADPLSGIQQHAMIYIPLAWVNIGAQYWQNAANMDESAGAPGNAEKVAAIAAQLKKRSFLGRALPLNCLDDAEMHLALQSAQSPQQFARALLKDVIFHEVGHSFGLAHDFKGSLAFDPDDPKKATSASIMDYNQYDEEENAFFSLDSSDGPLLEYDRQIISVLYNGGKDVKAADPVLPACADEEADSTKDGVDPLCQRYDIGADPTQEALRVLALFTDPNAKVGINQSLPTALASSLGSLPAPASVKTADDLQAAVKSALNQIVGTVSIYTTSSANSLGYNASTSLKSLKVFQDGVLPASYDANSMRDRALSILDSLANLNALPAASQKALDDTKAQLLAYAQATALVAGLNKGDQASQLATISDAISQALASNIPPLFSKARVRLINALTNTPTAPMAIQMENGKRVDVELAVLNALATMSTAQAGSSDRPNAERSGAIKALVSYSQSENFKPLEEQIAAALTTEINNATDATKRQQARDLLTLLQTPPAPPSPAKAK